MKSVENKKIDVFEYFDYRKYLADHLENVKKTKPQFSMRAFSRHCGFNSPNYISLILSKRRGLNTQSLQRVAKACKMSAQEARYFKALVEWNQSQAEEKDVFFDELYRIQLSRKQKQLSKSQNVILGKWYYYVLREMLLLPDFREDPVWISQRLGAQITPQEVESAFEILKTQGLIKKIDGKLVQSDPVITTTNDEVSPLIQQFHIDMIPQSTRAIRTNKVRDRDYRAMTMAISKDSFEKIKKEIKVLEEKIIQIASSDQNPQEIYQLNLQLFHITQGKDPK